MKTVVTFTFPGSDIRFYFDGDKITQMSISHLMYDPEGRLIDAITFDDCSVPQSYARDRYTTLLASSVPSETREIEG